MGIGSGTAMLVGGLAGAGGSLASGIMGSNAAQNAAPEQAQAAEQAAQLQYQASQNALGFQENEWNTEQNNLQPWLQSGSGALSNLDYLMGVTPQAIPGGAGSGATNFGSNPPSAGYGGAGMPSLGEPARSGGAGAPVMAGMPGSGISDTPQPFTPQTSSVSSLLNPMARSGGAGSPVLGSMPGVSARMSGAQRPTASVPTAVAPGQMRQPGAGTPGGFGSLMTPYSGQFSAPTAQQMEQNDPGYLARMQLGQQAMEQSAAARGNLLTGGTAQAENQLAQNYASNEYNNYYNQAYNTYATGYNQYEQNQANQFNRLSALAGGGQTAAQQLGMMGQSAANAVGSNLMGTAGMMGQDYQNAGAANASGIVGSANAWNGAFGGIGNNISQMGMLSALLGGGGGSVNPNGLGNELTDGIGA